ncbi:hypothetical protein E4T81_04105 [Barnesiella sp. WM24]|uniref:hypothetical protein n=1 Tax=Barnesiella sp. WM24 TaxID=2558278 RepID=UPI001072D1B9|nr:hypothetical protein [Barnesiella sp. WM24]TFU94433.1 hypothetical protein E4T81_04105 [Barnesiella sp. WM24]
MKLHEDKEQLADAIRITAAELGIPQKFVEKDFGICRYFRVCRDVLRRDERYVSPDFRWEVVA